MTTGSFPKTEKTADSLVFLERINSFLQQNDNFIVWGAGSYGKSVLKLLLNLKKKVSFLVDSDRNKVGTKVEGIEVKVPGEIRRTMDRVIIASLWWPEISNYIENEFSLQRWEDFI